MRFNLIITLAVQILGLSLGNEFHPQWKYDQWATDLKPGFIIEKTSSCPRCYCKVPSSLNTTTSTTSTSTTTSTTTTTTPTTTSTSTTSTPTTTSTSTTSTPTTTSTSTTTSTTTPTTTTTTSSTSTSSTSTTTGTTTTTDKNVYWSGQCSLSLTMSDGLISYWQSPLYDGGTTNYPEGEYCCSANITIPASFDMFMVTMQMTNPSSIHESSGCTGDQITYYSSAGTSSTFCGNIASNSWTEMQVYDGPKDFSFTWCSDLSDGGTDIGFQMKITGTDIRGGK